MMTKRLEYLCCEEKLGELGLLSLKSRSLRGGLFSAHKYCKRQCKEEEPWYFQQCLDKRQRAKPGSQEVPSEHWEAIHYCAKWQIYQRGCGISLLETFRNHLDFVQVTLPWVALCEQGMEQMDPEAPSKLSHGLILCHIQSYSNGEQLKQFGKSKAKGL